MWKSSYSGPRRFIRNRLSNKRLQVELLELQVESLEARHLLTTILDLDPGSPAPDTLC